VRWFRKQEEIDPLPVTMTGLRLGDRLLLVGGADPDLVALLARKTGLTGRVCLVEPDAEHAARAAAAVERAGALIETMTAAWGELPLESNSFDVAVARDVLFVMARDVRSRCLADVFRLLRSGGRLVVIEPSGRGGGLASLLSRKSADSTYDEGGATQALSAAGFAAVRVIAERDGVLYAEGAKRA
jgi:ubiquinone/menaquinone biosynthesis C-methylase UbiE